MTTSPTMPPKPWFDPKTGNPTEAFERHYQALWMNAGKVGSTLSRNVNSGVTIAQAAAAAAAAAQAAADAAATGVNDLGSQVLPFSAMMTPTSLSKSRNGAGAIVSNSMTVSWSGGTAPFTILWAIDSGDAINITSSTSASTTFSKVLGLGDGTYTVVRATVTDSLLAEATATGSNSFAELS